MPDTLPELMAEEARAAELAAERDGPVWPPGCALRPGCGCVDCRPAPAEL